MKALVIGLSLAGSCLSATTLGLVPVTYPVYLAYNAGDPEIELRALPFATRFSHPEHLGSCLSAPYVIPHNDSADLPKDINLISTCRIAVKTDLVPEKGRKPESPVGVHLTVDISQFAKPAYVPFEDAVVMRAVAKAVWRTVAASRCEIRSVKIISGENHEKLRKILEARLGTPIPAPAPQPAPAE
ncbi:MAG: hypothetical protein HKN82_07025 [Akkermansiaceae bacterium]|nr:hypothetical protein [Akkermansiaceae bacterium]NNM30406.1 hypothetical protein [Akkermansiaceae bacterium]